MEVCARCGRDREKDEIRSWGEEEQQWFVAAPGWLSDEGPEGRKGVCPDCQTPEERTAYAQAIEKMAQEAVGEER